MTAIDQRKLKYQMRIADAVLSAGNVPEAELWVLEVPVTVQAGRVARRSADSLVALVLRFEIPAAAAMADATVRPHHDPEANPLPFELHHRFWIGWPIVKLDSRGTGEGYTGEYFGRWVHADAVTWSDDALQTLRKALDNLDSLGATIGWTKLKGSRQVRAIEGARLRGELVAIRRELSELKRRTTTMGTLLLLDAFLD